MGMKSDDFEYGLMVCKNASMDIVYFLLLSSYVKVFFVFCGLGG
jgi:hypothetical protein